jgi:hypothetical protein|tara:strand:- start:182 stop:460 length:279 start_codon:yes stop_codon:yes gene_type:complete
MAGVASPWPASCLALTLIPNPNPNPKLTNPEQSGVNLTFVKNVLVRYMKEGDLDNSLPAIAQALEFTPDEVAEVRQANQGLIGEVGRAFKLW